MRWLKTVFAEIFRLFVDDDSFAITILVWLVVAGTVFAYVDIPAGVKGPVLFTGLAAILIESAVRRARPRQLLAKQKSRANRSKPS
jgi:hypothetical protein